MISTGYFKTNTEGKCDKCNHYTPRTKTYTNLGKVLTCHGTCDINHKYKQRTDTCKKFKSKPSNSDLKEGENNAT